MSYKLVCVSIDDETLKEVSKYQDKYKLSRSAVCRMAINTFFHGGN